LLQWTTWHQTDGYIHQTMMRMPSIHCLKSSLSKLSDIGVMLILLFQMRKSQSMAGQMTKKANDNDWYTWSSSCRVQLAFSCWGHCITFQP
jgi:hypothetical protein